VRGPAARVRNHIDFSLSPRERAGVRGPAMVITTFAEDERLRKAQLGADSHERTSTRAPIFASEVMTVLVARLKAKSRKPTGAGRFSSMPDQAPRLNDSSDAMIYILLHKLRKSRHQSRFRKIY
jgi:hypothetical protein